MLTGRTPTELSPIALPVQHVTNGLLGGLFSRSVEIPGSSPGEFWYFQFQAWDGERWGTNFAGVPAEWIGRTDVVPLDLVSGTSSPGAPHFTQPAIVPIPEPAVWALVVLGTAGLWLARCRRE